jgi:hypothetical protein
LGERTGGDLVRSSHSLGSTVVRPQDGKHGQHEDIRECKQGEWQGGKGEGRPLSQAEKGRIGINDREEKWGQRAWGIDHSSSKRWIAECSPSRGGQAKGKGEAPSSIKWLLQHKGNGQTTHPSPTLCVCRKERGAVVAFCGADCICNAWKQPSDLTLCFKHRQVATLASPSRPLLLFLDCRDVRREKEAERQS